MEMAGKEKESEREEADEDRFRQRRRRKGLKESLEKGDSDSGRRIRLEAVSACRLRVELTDGREWEVQLKYLKAVIFLRVRRRTKYLTCHF